MSESEFSKSPVPYIESEPGLFQENNNINISEA